MLTHSFTSKKVCKSTVILVQELVKFVLAMSMLVSSGKFSDAIKGKSMKSALFSPYRITLTTSKITLIAPFLPYIMGVLILQDGLFFHG